MTIGAPVRGCTFVVLLALVVGGASRTARAGAGLAEGEVRAGIAACEPGPRVIHGFQARVFCGPARATVTVNGKTVTVKNGVCERYPTYFLVNIGTSVTGIGKNRPKLPYFGLLMGRSPRSTWSLPSRSRATTARGRSPSTAPASRSTCTTSPTFGSRWPRPSLWDLLGHEARQPDLRDADVQGEGLVQLLTSVRTAAATSARPGSRRPRAAG